MKNIPRRSLEVLFIVVTVSLLLRGFTEHLDIHMQDEVKYQTIGIEIAHGNLNAIDAAWCPVSSIAYSLIDWLPLDSYLASDVMHTFVSLLGALSLYWCLLAFLPSALAVVSAIWWAGLEPVLQAGAGILSPTVYGFTSCLLFIGIGLVARRRYLPGIIFLVLTGINRSEYTPYVILLGIGLSFLGRRAGDKRTTLAGVSYSLVGSILFLTQIGSETIRARSWFAFRQHYALGLFERNPGSTPYADGGNAFVAPAWSIETSFPSADSVSTAFSSNPAEFLSHVASNLMMLPSSLARMEFSSYAHFGLFRITVALGFLLLLGLGFGLHFRTAWSAFRESLKLIPAAGRVALTAMVACTIGAIFIRAKPPLLLFAHLPVSVLFLLAAKSSVLAIQRSRPFDSLTTRIHSITLVRSALAVVVGLFLLFCNSPFGSDDKPPLPNREALQLCKAHLPAKGTRLAAYDGQMLALLARGKDARGFSLLGQAGKTLSGSEPSVVTLLRPFAPTHLLITPSLHSLRFKFDDLGPIVDSEQGSLGTEFTSRGGVRLIVLRDGSLKPIESGKPRFSIRIDGRSALMPDETTGLPREKIVFVAESGPPLGKVSLYLLEVDGKAQPTHLMDTELDKNGESVFSLVIPHPKGVEEATLQAWSESPSGKRLPSKPIRLTFK